MHWVVCALALARPKAGSNMAARMAIIAMTTRSSIRVKAAGCLIRSATYERLRLGETKGVERLALPRSIGLEKDNRGSRSCLFHSANDMHLLLRLLWIQRQGRARTGSRNSQLCTRKSRAREAGNGRRWLG